MQQRGTHSPEWTMDGVAMRQVRAAPATPSQRGGSTGTALELIGIILPIATVAGSRRDPKGEMGCRSTQRLAQSVFV